jgi:hypothetical protein
VANLDPRAPPAPAPKRRRLVQEPGCALAALADTYCPFPPEVLCRGAKSTSANSNIASELLRPAATGHPVALPNGVHAHGLLSSLAYLTFSAPGSPPPSLVPPPSNSVGPQLRMKSGFEDKTRRRSTDTPPANLQLGRSIQAILDPSLTASERGALVEALTPLAASEEYTPKPQLSDEVRVYILECLCAADWAYFDSSQIEEIARKIHVSGAQVRVTIRYLRARFSYPVLSRFGEDGVGNADGSA